MRLQQGAIEHEQKPGERGWQERGRQSAGISRQADWKQETEDQGLSKQTLGRTQKATGDVEQFIGDLGKSPSKDRFYR
jgi:hypothetical protein